MRPHDGTIPLLRDKTGAGRCRGQFVRMNVHGCPWEIGEAADVIEIEMRLDDMTNVARLEAERLDLLDRRKRWVDVRFCKAAKKRAQPCGHVRIVHAAETGVDQDEATGWGLDQHDVTDLRVPTNRETPRVRAIQMVHA